LKVQQTKTVIYLFFFS